MSEFNNNNDNNIFNDDNNNNIKKTRDVSTWQKLPPPKSLQGEEDAEVTWDLILKRYPNAAPLLCQMENVIERAEGLLHQLRSPYTHLLERSSSFQIADSEDELMGPCHIEESTEVSMISDGDSRLTSSENMTPEAASIEGCYISSPKLSDHCQEEREASVNSGRPVSSKTTDASIGEEPWSPEASTSSIYDYNSNRNIPSAGVEAKANFGQDKQSLESIVSAVNVNENRMTSMKLAEDPGEEVGVCKSSSLEAWGKVVGENVTGIKNFKLSVSKGGLGSKEDSVSEHARRLTSLKNSPPQQITKHNLLGKKEELVQRFAGTIATASKNVETNEKMMEKSGGEQRETVTPDPTGFESSDGNKVNDDRRNFEESKIEENIETAFTESTTNSRVKYECNEVQGNGDEVPTTGPRSPVEILEEYSKICEVPVEYENPTTNRSYNKVKCSLGGFAFEACAQGKKLAKKEAAAKLLRCLVGRLIDGENIGDLKPLTRNQIEEIISLGNGGEHETAVRKLYKICMELKAPEPVYTVQQGSGMIGNRYTVKCFALGITTSGYGLRILVAKRVAADKILQNYHANKSPINQTSN